MPHQSKDELVSHPATEGKPEADRLKMLMDVINQIPEPSHTREALMLIHQELEALSSNGPKKPPKPPDRP